MELELTNVAHASLEELPLDYQDYLRVRDRRQWDKKAKESLYVRKLAQQTPLAGFCVARRRRTDRQ